MPTEEEEQKQNSSNFAWKIPSFLLAIMGIGSLLANIYSNFADLRVEMNAMKTQQDISLSRIAEIDKRIGELDSQGSRPVQNITSQLGDFRHRINRSIRELERHRSTEDPPTNNDYKPPGPSNHND